MTTTQTCDTCHRLWSAPLLYRVEAYHVHGECPWCAYGLDRALRHRESLHAALSATQRQRALPFHDEDQERTT
jgi:hypothetical protein